MSNSDTEVRVKLAFLQSQYPVLSEFDAAKDKDPSNIESTPLSLDDTDLRILLAISQSDGIGAKALGQKVNLSRYAALARANKLLGLHLLVREELVSAKTGIKPTYIFHIAPDITKEAIASVIKQKESGTVDLFGSDGSTKKGSSLNTDTQPSPKSVHNSTEDPAQSLNQSVDINFFSRLQLSQLSPVALSILRFASRSDGITSNLIAQETNRAKVVVRQNLKQLFDMGLLIRKTLPTDTRANIYFLAPGLTESLINAALNPSEPKVYQQAVEKETPSTDPMPNFEEAQNQVNTVNPMQKESPQQQSESTQANEDTQTIPGAMEVIQELVTLYRKVSDLEESLRTMGGDKAEKLIKTLRAKKF